MAPLVWFTAALAKARSGGTRAVPYGAEGYEACLKFPRFHLAMPFAVEPHAVLIGAGAYLKVWHRPYAASCSNKGCKVLRLNDNCWKTAFKP